MGSRSGGDRSCRRHGRGNAMEIRSGRLSVEACGILRAPRGSTIRLPQLAPGDDQKGAPGCHPAGGRFVDHASQVADRDTGHNGEEMAAKPAMIPRERWVRTAPTAGEGPVVHIALRAVEPGAWELERESPGRANAAEGAYQIRCLSFSSSVNCRPAFRDNVAESGASAGRLRAAPSAF
jgi:hypothetical protein